MSSISTHKYWALKVHISTIKHNHELAVYRYLADFDLEHPGRANVRRLEDSFKLKSPTKDDSYHDVFVMSPLNMSLGSFQRLHETGVLQQTLVRSAIEQIVFALAFLHETNIVHTGKKV
jgi:serine/threonine protein kinase